MGKPTPESRAFEAPGLKLADALRPEVVARLELLRIVTAWRPQWDSGMVTKAAAELEVYVSGK